MMFVSCSSLMAKTHGVFHPRGLQASYELHLLYAESLCGGWSLHPESPISRDIREARNGGAIKWCGDRRIRCSQDCSVRDGGAPGFQEILELTPERFRMSRIARVGPGDIVAAPRGLNGVHTYNSDGSLEVIDGVWDLSAEYHGSG